VKRLIVNADDFGRTPGVNAGILEAHAGGIVTSATVMVLEPHAARGIRDAAERGPKLSLGVHFTLTGGGPPASAARAVPTLAPGGRFPRTAEELPSRIPECELRTELEAQIEVFHVLARRPPTHLDSHHHAARHPDVAPVFAAVARERSLPVRAVDDEDRRALREAGVCTPDRFFGDFYGPDASRATLEKILASLPDGVSELMCHPARVDDALRRGSSYADERDLEREVLCDTRLLRLVRSLGIELVGFDRVAPAR
jgi:predicted glycoside hydrolase/deacetylase ChbG (UPF0249 family)